MRSVMNKRISLCIACCLFYIFNSYSQNSNPVDTILLNMLNDSAKYFSQVGNYDASYDYSQKVLSISKGINSGKLDSTTNYVVSRNIANAFNSIGIVYEVRGDYSEALKNYTAGLKIRIKLNIRKNIASSYSNISNVYY